MRKFTVFMDTFLWYDKVEFILGGIHESSCCNG